VPRPYFVELIYGQGISKATLHRFERLPSIISKTNSQQRCFWGADIETIMELFEKVENQIAYPHEKSDDRCAEPENVHSGLEAWPGALLMKKT